MKPEERAHLDLLDRLDVPDLWPGIVQRQPEAPPPTSPSPLRRVGIVALALLVAGASFAWLVRLGLVRREGPASSPSPSARVSAANGMIYFRSKLEVGVPTAWEAVRPDGTGLRVVFPTSGSFVPDRMAFSPDGSRIAARLVGRPGIWVAGLDGSHTIQLTHGANDDWPSWSPDGTQIAFAGSPGATRPCAPRRFDYGCPRDLYVVNADGSGLRRITNDHSVDSAPSWSPNGRELAFEGSSRGAGDVIVVINADGSGWRLVARTSQGSDLSPAWSPDGKTIVYSSIRNEDWGIYSVSAEGGSERALVPAGSPLGFVDDPVWSPDGSMIAFVSGGGIGVMRADGSHPQMLTAPPSRLSTGAIAWRPQEVRPPPGPSPTLSPPPGQVVGALAACPALAGSLPPGANARLAAARTAREFVSASNSGDTATIHALSDPAVALNGLTKLTSAAASPVLESQSARRDGLVVRACGRTLAARTWRVTIDDGSTSASLDTWLYLIDRRDGWKVWAAY